jgi:serine/threonine protein kinase
MSQSPNSLSVAGFTTMNESPQLPSNESRTLPLTANYATGASVSQSSETHTFPFGETAPSTPTIPDLPPGYEFLRELGRGGMGVVYQARHTKLNRIVALKMILAGTHASASEMQRFLKEAESVAAMQHVNIVQIFETGQHHGLPYFTLEFVDGGTLASKARERSLLPKEAGQLVEHLARGMAYAHGKGIVHRDLKPENVLLVADGTPKIADFGLAKRLEASTAENGGIGSPGDELTHSGAVMGTPSYMAPEQAAGQKEVGPLADVYALGAILYRLLTGRPPFTGATSLDTMYQLLHQEPVPPRLLQPKVPLDLETICLKCLHKEPAKRYASAQALADDLRRFLASEPILARPVSAPERSWRWCKRNPRVALLSGAIALLLVVSLAIVSTLAYKLYREKENAQANERVALEQADLALDAIGEMIFDIQHELEDTPGAREAQISIMRKATGELNRLVNMPTTSDKYLRRHTLAHLQLGRLAWQTGDLPKAHEEFNLAVDFAEKAVAANPASDKARFNRAATRMELGRSFEYQFQKLDEAKEQYEAANQELLAMQTRLRALPDGDPSLVEAERINLRDTEDLLSQIYDLLGRTYYSEADPRKRDLNKANKFFQYSLEIRERLLAEKADHNIRSLLALSYTFLAEIAQFQDDRAGAAAMHRKVVQLREAIYQERRSSIMARRGLGGARMNYGDALCYNNQYDKALEQYRAALPLVEQVWLSEPDSLHSKNQYAQAHYCIGCLTNKTDHMLAQKHFEEALKLREDNYRVAEAKKGVTRMEYNSLMLTLAWCGQHERAARMAAEVKKGASPKILAEDVGATYGICMASVGADKKSDELTSQEQQLRSQYLALAIDAVRSAFSRGYDGFYYLERDPDFQPMRGVPAYEQLLMELRNARK